MKVTVFTLAALALIFSCNDKPRDTSTPENTDSSNAVVKRCYLNTFNKDSVMLELTLINNAVSGNLEYRRYEKDRNKGSIEGLMKGDTLIADYVFFSEGVQSVREVVFLKKGNTLIEGFGEMEEKSGKSVFKNTSSLTFDDKMALREVSCR